MASVKDVFKSSFQLLALQPDNSKQIESVLIRLLRRRPNKGEYIEAL